MNIQDEATWFFQAATSKWVAFPEEDAQKLEMQFNDNPESGRLVSTRDNKCDLRSMKIVEGKFKGSGIFRYSVTVVKTDEHQVSSKRQMLCEDSDVDGRPKRTRHCVVTLQAQPLDMDKGKYMRLARICGELDHDIVCVICQDPLWTSTSDSIVGLTCPCSESALYHKLCISSWLDLKLECPCCKTKLDTNAVQPPGTMTHSIDHTQSCMGHKQKSGRIVIKYRIPVSALPAGRTATR